MVSMNTPSEASAELARVVELLQEYTPQAHAEAADFLRRHGVSLLSSHGGGGEAVAWMRRNVTYREGYGRTDGERIVSERKVYPDDLPLYLHPATPASAWRPIAEAPRDGTAVLGLWMPSPGTFSRVSGNNYGIAAYNDETRCWNLIDDGDEPDEVMRPDYWMPLPTPPTSTKA